MSTIVTKTPDSDDTPESLDPLEPELDTGNLADLKPRMDVFEGGNEIQSNEDMEPEQAEETIVDTDISQEDFEMEKMEEELDEEAKAEDDEDLIDEAERKIRQGQGEFEPDDFEDDDLDKEDDDDSDEDDDLEEVDDFEDDEELEEAA
jgi:hypothetical protein